LDSIRAFLSMLQRTDLLIIVRVLQVLSTATVANSSGQAGRARLDQYGREILYVRWRRQVSDVLFVSQPTGSEIAGRIQTSTGRTLCSGAFTGGNHTGDYRQGFPGTDKTTKRKTSRAHFADSMLKQLTDGTYLHRTPGLSY
jgi:hypothetical protein